MQKKNSKGITLMTLMITIIILIILASVATYSGIHVINSSKLTAFTTEMKIMQTQVNSLYQKWKNGETIEVEETKYTGDDIVNNLGQVIDNNIQSNLVFTGDASGITNKEGYKYYSKELIKSLGIEGVRQEFFINIEKRSVISYKGLKYEGQMYYTLNQLPKGLYNVENENNDITVPIFTVRQNLIAKDKWKIIIEDIKYEGNINKWQIRYKQEGEKNWNTSDELSFIARKEGIYLIQIMNGNIVSDIVSEKVEKEVIKSIAEAKEKGIYYEETTKIKDDYENEILMLEDFKIAQDSATNVAEGIVIEDMNKNQFVWVPVGDIKKDEKGSIVNIELNRYKFANGTTDKDSEGNILKKGTPIAQDDKIIDNRYQELSSSIYQNITAKNLNKFIDNTKVNGGYYIGRYEAGVEGYTSIEKENTEKEISYTGYVGGKIVLQRDKQAYNYTTPTRASQICQSMYNKKDYEGDLINSYAWDTAIAYIQKCSGDEDYAWQTRIEENIKNTGMATDGQNYDVRCNIYDMAGNVCEYVTEACNYPENPCTYRGGGYHGSNYKALSRNYTILRAVHEALTFRPILY